MPAMLEASSLVKRFGGFTAVENISFKLDRGEVLGLLGPNGAGKTTTMKMLTGFLVPTSGTASIEGFDVASSPLQAKRRIGYLPEGAPLYGEMTPESFLRFGAAVRGLEGGELDKAVSKAVATLQLESVLHQSIETLSKGFKRRVGLAQAILHDPEVLILDEPTDGLDPNQKHEVRNLIRDISAEKAIVISTHLLEEVEAVCTRAMIIDQGRIVADDTPDALKATSIYHNAVHLNVEGATAKSLESALKAGKNVSEVRVRDEGGALKVVVLARGGRPILDTVHEIFEKNQWRIREISVEAGRLDDVFRSLTHGETGASAKGGNGNPAQGETGDTAGEPG